MKYLIVLFDILILVLVFLFSATGLGVHKTHAISVAAEIAKAYNVGDGKRNELEKTVSKTGNAAFYYSKIATTAQIAIAINLVLIGYCCWKAKREKAS